MELERRYSVLAVSASLKFVETLRTLLPEGRYGPVTVLHDAAAARRALAESSYDLVLINTPLPDEFGTRLALDACESSSAGVLLLVKAEHCPDIEAQVSAHGALTLAKPTSAQLFAQTLRLLCITRERLRGMEKKAVTLQEKMEEIRLVNRAKWLLIEELKMTEQEAHRYIEKQAMDRCVTRRAVAEQILSIYQ